MRQCSRFAFSVASCTASSLARWAFILVMNSPGQMTFVEILRLPSAFARPTDICDTAAFEAESARQAMRSRVSGSTSRAKRQMQCGCSQAQAATGLSAEAGERAATLEMLTWRQCDGKP